MNLGDRVLRPAPGPKPVGARLKVSLKDRFQHQLEGGLHDPVADRRDPQPTRLAAALGDQTLLHRSRPKAPAAQLLAELAQEPLNTQPAFDVIGVLPIHAGQARPPVGPHPPPRHHQRGRVADEVVEVVEPPLLIVFCPLVQLALDPEYPRLGRFRPGPRRGAIQRRPPRLPGECCKSAASLRHVAGFPDLGLLRRLRPTQGPTADSEPARTRRAAPGWFPRSSLIDRRGRHPAFPLQPRHEYAADLPHGLRAGHEIPATESPPPPGTACTASRPTSARLEPMPRLRRFNHWFALAAPSRLACRTQAVWRYRPVPSLSGLLPPAPCASKARLPPASATRCDGPPFDISFHSINRRLVAHFALSAHPDKSQGRPPKSPGSEPIVQEPA